MEKNSTKKIIEAELVTYGVKARCRKPDWHYFELPLEFNHEKLDQVTDEEMELASDFGKNLLRKNMRSIQKAKVRLRPVELTSYERESSEGPPIVMRTIALMTYKDIPLV